MLLPAARTPDGGRAMASSALKSEVRLFLAGDVMPGRGIDQILPARSDPKLHESYVKSALRYVELAESAGGPIPKPVSFTYPWGDALEELEEQKPDYRIINLETAVTTSDDFWPDKGIHYRMHPANVPLITAAGIDCCVLANNHVLDWGHRGLVQTVETLREAGLDVAGAGSELAAARAPSILAGKARGRVLVFAYALPSSGVPRGWAATKTRPGVSFLPHFSEDAVRGVGDDVRRAKRPGDLALASIHWGGNWGYEIPAEQRAFAHRLIDEAGVDLVHGHSSHHPKAIEVWRGRPILYGCGDFLNDYEGIGGHASYRPDLVLMYVVTLRPGSNAAGFGEAELVMIPFEIRGMRLRHASRADSEWIAAVMDRQCAGFGGAVRLTTAGRLRLIH